MATKTKTEEWVEDLPPVKRPSNSGSKYVAVLDELVENPGAFKQMKFDTQSQASSRAASIKKAAEGYDANGEFEVHTRTLHDEEQVAVLARFTPSGNGTKKKAAPKSKAKSTTKKTTKAKGRRKA